MNRNFVWAALVILLVGSVSALGVSPARTTLDFEGGLSQSVNFDVSSSSERDTGVVLSVQGELAPHVSLPVSSSVISASEKTKPFSYDLNLPERLEPGLHTADIYILEVPSGSGSGEAHVMATLAVVTQIHVYVPYPGKYANADLRITGSNSGGGVVFIFPVVSAGKFDLTSVKANIDIYNKLNEKVDSFTTDSIGILSGQKKDLIYEWDADVPVGDYLARAALVYDEGTINLEKEFKVGSDELVLQQITTNKFNLGEIVKLEMLVENKWSEPIERAYVKTKIFDSDGDIVSSFESAAYDIAASSRQAFLSYWDTAGVREGNYEAEVSVVYGDKKSANSLEFQVSQNELTVIGLGYVISEDDGGANTLVFVLVAAVVVLILINLLWFMFLRKRLKK